MPLDQPSMQPSMISPLRYELYKGIYKQMEQLLGREAKLVFTAGMGSSIEDILLNVPIADNGIVVIVDHGPFEDTKPVDENSSLKTRLLNNKNETNGSNYWDTEQFDEYEDAGIGRATMVRWKIEALGGKVIEINSVSKSDLASEMIIQYKGKTIKLVFISGHTVLMNNNAVLNEYLDEKDPNIDVIVDKASDSAFNTKAIRFNTARQLRHGGVILSDSLSWVGQSSMNLPDLSNYFSKKDQVLPSPEIQAVLNQGQRFGYPENFEYNAPLVLIKKP